MADKDTIDVPDRIKKLAEQFRDDMLKRERIAEERQIEQEATAKRIKAERLAGGLEYARKVFDWAEAFRQSDVGKELMRVSHIPTAYGNIFFFDANLEGIKWVGLGVSRKGFFLDTGGRNAALFRQTMESAEKLAEAVDTIVLKTASDWIDDGRVWDCIERRFEYLSKK